MKILRYEDPHGKIYYGIDQSGGCTRIDGSLLGDWRDSGEAAEIGRILAPVSPPAIFCIGGNYRRHVQETGGKITAHPAVFHKGINTVQHPGVPIQLPRHMLSEMVDYECELAVVIGRHAKNVSKESALSYVLGYTCANDVSARDWQKHAGSGQWCKGKGFDTFCPMGPVLVTADEIPDPNNLAIRTEINEEVLQDWNTSDMIFDVPTIVEFLSASTTLLPGTVILTGTPHGVGMARTPFRWLKAGDVVTIEIEKIGRLTNPVEEEPAPVSHRLIRGT